MYYCSNVCSPDVSVLNKTIEWIGKIGPQHSLLINYGHMGAYTFFQTKYVISYKWNKNYERTNPTIYWQKVSYTSSPSPLHCAPEGDALVVL